MTEKFFALVLCIFLGFHGGKRAEGNVLTEAMQAIRNISWSELFDKNLTSLFFTFPPFCIFFFHIECRVVPKNLFLEPFLFSDISVAMLLERFFPLNAYVHPESSVITEEGGCGNLS